ncbi:hypothetical protein BCR43DRAFT_504173 [Syncephalastrum racemosum]|uniref:Galactose oxidase n=1 Tax=Syncephalastrum racemosum TaxID=13706 RepID=A0A1X2HE38_SYNRA|nr:hypothetical protein BCR43DRAFT_504173 [Syncephalastrum racemosum]
MEWQRLRADPAADRFGHTAAMLSDGRMVVLGGMHGSTTDLYGFDHALIYDTIRSAWSTQALRGKAIPPPRMHHSAATTATDNIIICGGQDGAAPPFQTYASADRKLSHMAALLNTQTWEWTLARPSADQPLPQAMAASAIINGTNFIYGLGVTYQTTHDGLSILDSSSMLWMPKETDGIWMENKPSANVAWSTWIIVVLVLSILACLGLTWLMFSLGKRIWLVVSAWATSLKMEVWNPRTGEPGWAESTRLTLKTVSLCVLTYLVFSLVEQILNSPTIYQKFYQASPDMTIEAPDIRLCFQGSSALEAYVRCATDYGASCSNYVEEFTPSQAHAGGSALTQRCFLFRPPSSFKLGPTEARRDQQADPFRAGGSYLKLDYYYPGQSEMTIQLSLYHPKHDPNPIVYNLSNPEPSFAWDDPHELIQFRRNTEQRHSDDLLSRDLFMLDPPHRIYTASYTIQERVVLDPESWWNYIGIASQSSRRYELADVAMTAERHAPSYNALPAPVGSLHVYPSRYDTHVVVEQRAFAVVNAIGVLGGLFGLLVAGQTWLFGYRPRSPWGIIQRWSIGQMKYSLLQGLYGTFFRGSHVPIAHPLAGDEDEGTVMDERTRLRRLEDRMHTLERLFQAYYIDDEIFRSLDQAFTAGSTQHKDEILTSSSSVPTSSCASSLRIRNPPGKPT